MSPEVEKISISTDEDLQFLVNRFQNGPSFAMAFDFMTDELWEKFACAIDLNLEEFNSHYYYFDKKRGIHISESENGYVWISTMGLVAKSRSTDNKYVNACCWQKMLLIHLLDDAISLSNDDRTYDIDGYNYSMVEELTPALFHNTIFYFETLAKAYLSIYKQEVPPTHKLDTLLVLVKKTMFRKHQNNTLFHAHTIPMFEGVVKHIGSIPGPFKEQYVKYDDNPQDTTFIVFHPEHLKEVRNLIEITYDMVSEMYYNPDNCMYLGRNLYQRLLNNCESAEDKDRLANVYGFLLDKPDNPNEANSPQLAPQTLSKSD